MRACDAFVETGARQKQPFLGLAILVILKHDSPDAIVTKLAETCDRVSRCASAKRMAYNLLIAQAAGLLERQEHHGRSDRASSTDAEASGGAVGEVQSPSPEPDLVSTTDTAEKEVATGAFPYNP